MSKHIDKLKKQLMEISEVVNSFKSEAVQVKIIDKLFAAMSEFEEQDMDNNSPDVFNKRGRKRSEDNDYSFVTGRKNWVLPRC